MIFLSDNDIVEKLAVCDLLDETLAAYEVTRSEVHVVPTLKYRIGGKARVKAERRLGEPAVARILEFLRDVREIGDYSPETHLLLDDMVGIDAGETVLLAAAAGVVADFRMLTGDKRCLRTLATREDCRPIALHIQGRVICFEQVIRRLIEHYSFEYVLARVVPVLFGCDTALRAAFGSGVHSTEPNAIACLQGYIDEIRGLPIDLLVDDH